MNATSPALAKPRLFWRMGTFVFFAVLFLAIPQAALLPLLDRDEPRFAEASREMLQSGNIIVPTFNNTPRYAKPPLIYWCQAVSFKIFGQTPFAARLPSLLATAGTALLLFVWGSQLGYKTIGLIAAFSYAFCLQTVQQGRVATADALLIFFMTLTGFAGWQLLSLTRQATSTEVNRRWSRWGWVLTAGFAAGFLAKGPEALLPLLPLLICARTSGKRDLFSLVAILLLSLAIVALWAVPAFVMTHGDYWRSGLSEGIGERMISGLQGHGANSVGGYLLSLPLYLVLFWLSALLWSPLLVIYRNKLFAARKPDLLDTYLLFNAGLTFLVFSLMVTKLPHYTLPAFPFIALFFARRWVTGGLSPWLPIKLSLGFGIGFALFVVVFIPIAMANHLSPSPVGDLVRKAEFNFAFDADTKFAYVDFQEPNVVWEMRHVSTNFGQAIPESEVFSFLNQGEDTAVLLSTELWQKIKSTAPAEDRALKTYEARGLNAAKGKSIDLTLVVRPRVF